MKKVLTLLSSFALIATPIVTTSCGNGSEVADQRIDLSVMSTKIKAILRDGSENLQSLPDQGQDLFEQDVYKSLGEVTTGLVFTYANDTNTFAIVDPSTFVNTATADYTRCYGAISVNISATADSESFRNETGTIVVYYYHL